MLLVSDEVRFRGPPEPSSIITITRQRHRHTPRVECEESSGVEYGIVCSENSHMLSCKVALVFQWYLRQKVTPGYSSALGASSAACGFQPHPTAPNFEFVFLRPP
nr:hypothetical protein CFP56_43843 [Quercus suber]